MDLETQIRRLYEEDRIKNAKAVHASDIPLSYEHITPEWMTHIVCKDQPEARVVEVVLGPEDNGSANRRRIFLKYNAAGQALGLPDSVFCKASQDVIHRIALAVAGATHAEVTFYNNVRPLIDLEIPWSYFAAYDKRSFCSIIVLKDIGNEVEFFQHSTPVNRERAEGQIEFIASYHSQFQENPRYTAETLGLVTWQEYFAACASTLAPACANGFRAAESVIPPRLFQRHSEIWPATIKSVENHDHLPATLIHGDCHLKQWYVRKRDGQLGLPDWQGAAFGNWGRDLPYIVATSLAIEDRRRWEKDLLRLYLQRMQEKGAAVPGFDAAWTIYRQNLLSAMAWWTTTLTPSATQPDMQPPETSLEFIKRLSTAIDDLDALDAF